MTKFLNPPFEALLNFVYPPFCIICEERLGSGEKSVCEKCWHSLSRIDQSKESDHTALVPNEKTGIYRVLSLWEFNDNVQKIIYEMKYFRKTSLARRIGKDMANLIASDKEYRTADLIIPVPLHKTKLRERGYNQSRLLSEAISSHTQIAMEQNGLTRIRYTETQSKLSAVERESNVRGAFTVSDVKLVMNRIVILVDDVFTTGSTLRACAEALINSGSKKILALTAAKTVSGTE